MSTASRTWGVHEKLLDPQALPPPPVRHALLVFLIALTAMLHLGTAGWGEVQNGAEGTYAAGARRMLDAQTRFVPIEHGVPAPNEPPLLFWLLIASYHVFGVSAVAARVPSALAMICSVAFTFLIGERLSGYWRGFAAGLIQLCSLGTFIWCRMATPEPLFTALFEATIFCLICGYQKQRERRWWFTGFGVCAVLASLTHGVVALGLLGAVLISLATMFREARLRFRALFQPSNLLPFAVVALWFVFSHRHGGSVPGLLQWPSADDAGELSLHLLPTHFIWFFPAVLLIAPGVIFAWRKVIRPHEFEFTDALPLCWLGVAVVWLLWFGHHADSRWAFVSPAFALSAAAIWECSPQALRNAGLLLALVCLAAAWAVASGDPLRRFTGDSAADIPQSHARLLASGFAIASFGAAAFYARGRRERLAICFATLGVLPLGLAAAETVAQLGPHLSFASAAQLIQQRLGSDGKVIYEGSPRSGSSLEFYLDRQPIFVSTQPQSSGRGSITAEQAVEEFAATRPVYLISPKERTPFWQERLTSRYHIYHQVSTCGRYVVATNQP